MRSPKQLRNLGKGQLFVAILDYFAQQAEEGILVELR